MCRRLDGIPLAIELAAARLRALGLCELAARLDQRLRLLISQSPLAPPRQQTLRASLDGSYALQSEAERTLFGRLAVFVGGWTIEAAESVCSDGSLPGGAVLDLPAGDALGVTHCLDGLASVAVIRGAPARAARLFAAADGLRRTTGGGPPPLWNTAREHGIAFARASLGKAPFEAAWAEGSCLSVDEALAEALEMEGSAALR